MYFLRNTIGVLAGLTVAALIITLGVKIDSDWITYKEFAPFEHWERLLQSVQKKDSFFIALLFFGGLGVTFGGVVTAMIVKYAKVAYAILIGFIMLFIAHAGHHHLSLSSCLLQDIHLSHILPLLLDRRKNNGSDL